MNWVRTLQTAAFCGILAMATAAMADSISVTIIENGNQVYAQSGAGTSLILNTTEANAALTGLDISGLNVNAYNFTTEGELYTIAMLSSSGVNTFGIDVIYNGFTVPNSTTTLGSSSSYTDSGISGISTLTYQSFGGSANNPDEASSALTNYTLATGYNGSGANTTSPTYFSPAYPYSLSQDYVWDAPGLGGQITAASGTTTAYNDPDTVPVPEGGAALAYLLLAAAACFGAMRFGKLRLALD